MQTRDHHLSLCVALTSTREFCAYHDHTHGVLAWTWNAAQGEFRLPPAIPDRPGTRGWYKLDRLLVGSSVCSQLRRGYLGYTPETPRNRYVTAWFQPKPPAAPLHTHGGTTTGPRQERARQSWPSFSEVRVGQCTIGMVGWRATGLLRKPSAIEATRAPINGPEWGDP